MAPPRDPFRESLANLLQQGKYSDLTIRCQDKAFPAHCAIVCAQSSVIARAIDGTFKEAVERVYTLDDDNLDIVAKMMDYLYKGDYDDEQPQPTLTNSEPAPPARGFGSLFGAPSEWPPAEEAPPHEAEDLSPPSEAPPPEQANPEESSISPYTEKRLGHLENDSSDDVSHKSPLQINAEVYVLADKYDLQQLKVLAASKYQKIAPSSWDSPGFRKSTQTVYENTMESDRLLRDIIASVACNQVDGLLGLPEFVDVLRSNGELSTDILQLVAQEPSGGWSSKAKAKGKKGRARDLLMNQGWGASFE